MPAGLRLIIAMLSAGLASGLAVDTLAATAADFRPAEPSERAAQRVSPTFTRVSREAPQLEARLSAVERLSLRDPRQALRELARFDPAGLSAHGRLRLAVAETMSYFMLFDADTTQRLVERHLPTARQLQDPVPIGYLILARAGMLTAAGHSDEGLAALEEARRQAQSAGDTALLVIALNMEAHDAAVASDFPRAFDRIEKAQQIADADGRPALRAICASASASIFRAIDDSVAALQALESAERWYREDGDPTGEADSARIRATILINTGRAAEAVEPLQRALARHEVLGDVFAAAIARNDLARARSRTGQAERALLLNAEALAALRPTGGLPLANVLLTRIELLTRHRDGQGALVLLDEVERLLTGSADLRLRKAYYKAAADAFAVLGRYRDAHEALSEHLRFARQYDDQRLSQQLLVQRGRIERRAMAAELERAQNQAEAQTAALLAAERTGRTQSLLIVLAVAGCALALYALQRVLRRSHRISTLAQTDDLTGVYNRRRIAEIGQALLVRCRQRDEPFSVLMLDLDDYKSINDRFGHDAGDRALRAVTAELKQHLRASDELGRYGGDEFVAVLPCTTPERARVIAERLRAAIEALPTDRLGLDRRLTLSIGIAGGHAPADLDALLRQADNALYAAKQAGRNRVTSWDAQVAGPDAQVQPAP